MKTDVKFVTSGNIQIAGSLHSPDSEKARRLPAIVVSHPGSGVKEQTASLYANRLAEAGFIALAFDCAYQGESGGEPRGLEDPAQRVEDIKAAVSYLETRPDVDSEHTALLGICASGGYSIAATVSDHRIEAVATVSGVDMALQFRRGADGNQAPAVFENLLDAAAKARTAEALGEGVQRFPLFPGSEGEARTGGQHLFEGWEYYRTSRAQHPRSMKAMTWNSVDKMAIFDAFRFIDLVSPRPLLFILGSKAVTKWMGIEAFERAKEPKELMWIDGASHVDLYDKPEYVDLAVAKLSDFFHNASANSTSLC
ncbi:MAG TPA: alpha/beta hydrolase [Terracidiphilus sp.]